MDDRHDAVTVTRRGALRLLLGAGALALTPRVALADTQAELDEAERQLAEVERQLDQIAAEYEELSLEQSRTLEDIYEVRTEIDDTQRGIEKQEAELAAKQERLGRRISSVYKSGGNDLLSILLSASTFEELFSGIYYMDKISEADHRMIDAIRSIKQALADKKAQLELHESELEELSARQQEQLDAMRTKQAEVQTVIDGLSKQVRELVAKRDEELAAAAAAAAAAEEAERARAAAASRSGVASPAILVSGASGSQAAVLSSCYVTPSAGYGYCAGWVTNVFANAGVGYYGGNACDMYSWYCYSSSVADLKPGMIVAVSSHPSTVAGRIYGHVGIYIGGGMVMQNVGPITTQSLDDWCAYYGKTVIPRWGWLGGVQLA